MSTGWVLARQDLVDALPVEAPLRHARLLGADLASIAGHAERARSLAAPLLQDPVEGGRAAFLLACVALDEGRLAEAEGLVRQLSERSRDDATVRTLSQLVVRRRDRPQEPWPDALVRAWYSAGSPEVRASPLLVDPSGAGWPPSVRWTADGAAGGAAFLAAYEQDLPPSVFGFGEAPEPVPEPLLARALALPSDSPAVLRMLAARVLAAPEQPESRPSAGRETALILFGALARERREEALWLLWPLALDRGAPLSAAEQACLDEALARPRWGPPLGEVGPALEAELRASVHPEAAKERAFGLSVDVLGSEVASALGGRLRATLAGASPEVRERLARSARAMAERLEENGTHLMAAWALLGWRIAADASDDEVDRGRAEQIRATVQRAYATWGGPRKPLGHWPIRRYALESGEAVMAGELAFFAHLDALARGE